MAKLNCWEFAKCGREPKGQNAHKLGVCPAAVFYEADGFCEGSNGGRACMYIAGTFCQENISGTHREDRKNCGSCDFYRILKQEHDHEMSALSFQTYIAERDKNIPGTSSQEIYKACLLPRAHDTLKANGPFHQHNRSDLWLRLLELVDSCNHAVKRGEWYQEDETQYYSLKDSMMEKLFRNPPPGALITIRKTAYMKRLNNNGDDTSAMSRNIRSRECPLSGQENPADNTDVKRVILIEMEVTYENRIFCLHIPVEKTKDWDLNSMELSSKEWIPSCEFNRHLYKDVFEEIQQLLNCV
jgi:hypothetical protein